MKQRKSLMPVLRSDYSSVITTIKSRFSTKSLIPIKNKKQLPTSHSTSLSSSDENESSLKSQVQPTSSSMLSNSPKLFQNGSEKSSIFSIITGNSGNDEGGSDKNGLLDIKAGLDSGRESLTKFKDQITQHARTVITSPTSITSILTNKSSTNEKPSKNTDGQVYWVDILIEKGRDLASKDIDGNSDPYIKVFYGTEEQYTTTTIESDLNPVWNEKFTFFASDLSIPLNFYVYDHDAIGRDESMGKTKLDLSKLPLDHLYAATLELEDELRNDGKIGTIKVSIKIMPKPSEFRDEVLRLLAKQQQTRARILSGSTANTGVIVTRRSIEVFIVQGRNLLSATGSKKSNPFVRLKFGANKKYRTETIKYTTAPKWNQSFMYDTTSAILPPLELTVYDDVSLSGEFIGRAVCNVAHLDEDRTHKIAVELEDGAGIIDVLVTITSTTPLQEATNDGDSSANVALESIPSKLTADDYRRYSFLSTIRSMNTIFDLGRLEIKVYQARDLSSKDINGKSDPFCVVELDSNRLRTHTVYKTLNPAWNKSFVIPVQDIHSILDIFIYDEDANQSTEFIGRVAIPLLAIKNGEKKWVQLKDEDCRLPVKGAVQIEATFIYTNIKALIRTFNPRQESCFKGSEKFSPTAIQRDLDRIRNRLEGFATIGQFIVSCFRWENPWVSFGVFMAALTIIWNFELYMLPFTLLFFLTRNFIHEYRRGRFQKPYAILDDDDEKPKSDKTEPTDEELKAASADDEKKSFFEVLQSIQETILEIQGYVDAVASTLERIKNLFNFTVPWLTTILVVILIAGGFGLQFVSIRYIILGVVINLFTKRFRKPPGFVDNNELADYMSRLPSDTELMRYRELKVSPSILAAKKRN